MKTKHEYQIGDLFYPTSYAEPIKHTVIGLGDLDTIYGQSARLKRFDKVVPFHISEIAPWNTRPKAAKGARLCPRGTEIQTLIFSKDNFTQDQAKDWAWEHDFNAGIDEKENTYRMRQQHPSKFKDGTFRTIDITDGIKAVIGCPIAKAGTGAYWIAIRGPERTNIDANGTIAAKGSKVENSSMHKNWEVKYLTFQGKAVKEVIRLGRMSDKFDVQQALKRRSDTNIREVLYIKELPTARLGSQIINGAEISIEKDIDSIRVDYSRTVDGNQIEFDGTLAKYRTGRSEEHTFEPGWFLDKSSEAYYDENWEQVEDEILQAYNNPTAARGGRIITFSDGYRFRVVSEDYAKKNWEKESIYLIHEDEESESLVQSEDDIREGETYGKEIGFKAARGIRLVNEDEYRARLRTLIDELTDIGIDLDGEEETIIAGLRLELEDAIDLPTIEETKTMVTEKLTEFEESWADDLPKKERNLIAGSINKFKTGKAARGAKTPQTMGKDRKYTSDQPHEKRYKLKRKSRVLRYKKS